MRKNVFPQAYSVSNDFKVQSVDTLEKQACAHKLLDQLGTGVGREALKHLITVVGRQKKAVDVLKTSPSGTLLHSETSDWKCTGWNLFKNVI